MTVTQDITFDHELFVGEDKVLTFTVKDEAGNRVSISGWTLVWTVRKNRYAVGTPIMEMTTAGGGITLATQTGGTLGDFSVAIERTDTQNLKAGTYYHAAARTNAGNYDVVSEGALVLRKATAR